MNRIACVSLLVPLIASIATAGGFADYLPEKTLVYVSAENLARTRERAKKSPLLAMWNAPAMEGARREADRLGRKGAEERIRASEFATLLQGRACVATVPIGRTESAFVVLVELKGDRAAILDMLERSRARNNGEDVRTEEQEFRGFRITTYRELIEGKEEPLTTFTFINDDLYGYCDSLDVAKDIITRKDASESTGLGSVAAFRNVVASTGERCDVRLFVSASAWRRGLQTTDMMTLAIVALGLNVVNGMGGALTLQEHGIRVDALIQHDGEPQGLLKLLANDVEDLGPPALLPADATQSFTWAVDWSLVHAETMRTLARFAPQVHQEVQAVVTQGEKALGLRLRQDILAALARGTTFALLHATPSGDGNGTGTTEDSLTWDWLRNSAVAFQELVNKETIANLLKKLTTLDGSAIKAVPYLGTTIYDGTAANLPSCAILGNHLVLTAAPDSLRTLIRRLGKELKGFRDTPDYERATELVPGKRSFLMLASSTSGSNGWPFQPALSRNSPEKLGAQFFAATPDKALFSRYEGMSTLSLSRAEHGLLITSFWGLKDPESRSDSDEE